MCRLFCPQASTTSPPTLTCPAWLRLGPGEMGSRPATGPLLRAVHARADRPRRLGLPAATNITPVRPWTRDATGIEMRRDRERERERRRDRSVALVRHRGGPRKTHTYLLAGGGYEGAIIEPADVMAVVGDIHMSSIVVRPFVSTRPGVDWQRPIATLVN